MATITKYIDRVKVPSGSDTIENIFVDNASGYTKNTGTVTSVQVQASSPIASSVSTAQSTTLSTTISHNKVLGDANAKSTPALYPVTIDAYGHITSAGSAAPTMLLRGSVETVDDLPSSGNTLGDVYYVIDGSTMYIWVQSGTEIGWQPVSIAIDTSDLLTTSDLMQTTGTGTTVGMSQNAITTALGLKANLADVPTSVSQLANDSSYATTSEVNSAIGSMQTTINQSIATITDRIVIDSVNTKMVDATYTSYILSGNGIVSTVISGSEQFNVQSDGAHATVYSSGDWHIQKMNNNNTWAFFRK